jgi:fluoride exporter
MKRYQGADAEAAPPGESRGVRERWAMSETAGVYLAISAGAVIGSVLRALATMAALAWLGPGFPWGTLFVNIAGSFVIGFYATLAGPGGLVLAGPRRRHFVTTGICGGFTTFSAFSLETFVLLQQGNRPMAALNVGVSVAACLAAVWLGHSLATSLNRRMLSSFDVGNIQQ